jgi:limonene-1,2-epoxide hydrolase
MSVRPVEAHSIVMITDGKVTWWRDYLDPIAVFDASGWPTRAD